MMAEQSLYMTSLDVAGLLGVSVRTVWRLVKTNQIPQPIRYNRKLVRWVRSSLMEWHEIQRQKIRLEIQREQQEMDNLIVPIGNHRGNGLSLMDALMK
jgi:predicted DNA-binding transcriptional regulator AlpA